MQTPPKHRNGLSVPMELLALAILVGLVTYAGMILAQHAGRVSTIWPANGVLLGILLMARPTIWPAYLITGLVANIVAVFFAGYSIDFFIRLPLVNFVEITLTLTLLHRYLDPSYDLSQPKILWRFALITAGIAPFISALLSGTLFFLIRGELNAARFIGVFFAHALGIITITPVILASRHHEMSRLLAPRRIGITIISFGLLLGVTTLVFVQSRYPLLFLVYPPLVLVVCMFGLSGGALGLFLSTLGAIVFTLNGHGPITLIPSSNGIERIIVLQLFALVAAVLVLVLSAILAERDRVANQLEAARAELAQLATTDGLTGLANRRRLDDVLAQEYRRATRDQKPLSLIMLDVDHFKAFNDHYGHQAGDECLRAIAAVVSKFGRRPGDLSARYGGEELVVLLSSANTAAATTIAEAIRAGIQALALPHAGNNECGNIITASLGVATYEPRNPPGNPQTLIAQADKMLYEAKRTGRNKVTAYV